MRRFTVLGAGGFIGGRAVNYLRRRGVAVEAPPRDADLAGRDLGHVLYCIGLTADFRKRPFDTVTAHVCRLQEVLMRCEFESLVYLSSTRVYQGHTAPVDEDTELWVNAARPGDLYNLSKLMGESLVLHGGRAGGKVARLANVYGDDFRSDNFLPAITRQAIGANEVMFETALASAKDYIYVEDVIPALVHIATVGKAPIYNVAGGVNVSNAEIGEVLASQTGCRVQAKPGAPVSVFPPISNHRLCAEFDFRPASLVVELPRILRAFQQHRGEWPC
jgi:nucleoside-diphosphate-sugar epimerase